MFTDNSPKRRKALRRFGDRARSTGAKRRKALRRFGDRARSVRREEAKGAVMAVEIEAAGRVVGEEVMEVRVADWR